MNNLAVFASGRGSNFRAIIDHERMGVLQNVKVALLISNEQNAPALKTAEHYGIPCEIVPGVFGRSFATKSERSEARRRFDEKACSTLKEHRIDLVALAGFMQVLGSPIIDEYYYRIMNIHPAVDLKRFGGRGMYGERVHEAVLRAGERTSGCTIHYVDASVDGGPIILQTNVPVHADDSPESLAHRILIQEHRTYSKAIQLHADGKIGVKDGCAVIDWSGGWQDDWNRRQDAYIQHQMLEQENIVQSAI